MSETTVTVPIGWKRLDITARKKTTDIKVIQEVLRKKCYQKKNIGFIVEQGERWLDLGGNIGTFALFVLAQGGTVHSVEPEPENIKMLRKNLESNFKTGWTIGTYCVSVSNNLTEQLYLCKGDYNKYMHKLGKVRGRQCINVDNVNFRSLMKECKYDCIKMDIEGAEIEILETIKPEEWAGFGIKKLVFEYSFNCDSSIPRFIKIIRLLEQHFTIVKFNGVNENEKEFKHWPNGVLVYCIC